MSARQKIEAQIEKKRAEISNLQAQIHDAELIIQGMQEALKHLPKEANNGTSTAVSLRPGTDLAKVRDYIKRVGRPVPIMELLEGIGKKPTTENRASLAGNIGWYVRRNEIFTRPAPNTFGLIDMESDKADVENEKEVIDSEDVER